MTEETNSDALVLNELNKLWEAECKASELKELSMSAAVNSSEPNEDEIRKAYCDIAFKEPQNLLLNPKQARIYARATDTFEIQVPLRNRVLAAGEKVILLTDWSQHEAEVVKATRVVPEKPKYGYTDLILRKI